MTPAETFVSILSADNSTAATIHAAVVHAENVNRVAPPPDVEHVSPELAEQIRRVQVEGERPTPTLAGGAEVALVQLDGRPICTRTVSGNDLRLHRDGIKTLLGDINVLGLHWKYYLPVARYAVLARAYWLQEELGKSAEAALLEAIQQIYGHSRQMLAETRKGLYTRITAKVAAAKWNFQPTKDQPHERYPLSGISARDSRSLYRELEDLITSECRSVQMVQRLLAEVLNESDRPLLVVFDGEEELAFTPGVQVDWLKVAQGILVPRPNVLYVAEELIHLRMSNDSDRVDVIEGFNPSAGALVWSGIVANVSVPKAVRTASGWSLPRRPAIAASILLPVFILLFAAFQGFTAAMAVLGLAAAVGLEACFLTFADRPRKKPTPVARPVSPPAPPAAAPATPTPAVVIPTPIKERAGLNGTLAH
jgi:hypothetical protein